MSPVDWEEIGWIDVDAAGVAFCTEGTRLSEPQINSTHAVEDGIVYQVTKEDCPLPVEVRRDDVGDIVAARMCFTNDVDVIEGSWVHIGNWTSQTVSVRPVIPTATDPNIGYLWAFIPVAIWQRCSGTQILAASTCWDCGLR